MKQKKILICVFIYVLFMIAFVNTIKKLKFESIDAYWFSFTFIFLLFFVKTNLKMKRIMLSCLLLTPRLMIPLIFWLSSLFVIISGTRGWRTLSSFLLKSFFHLKIDVEKIPKQPTIYLCNYPSCLLEYSVNTLLSSKICLVIQDGAYAQFAYHCEDLIQIKRGGSFDLLENKIVKKMKEGYSIWVYVEKDWKRRKTVFHTTGCHSGIFKIAKKINATITPVVIDHITHMYGIIENFKFEIFVDETRKIENIDIEIKKVEHIIRKKLKKFSLK